MSSLPPILVVVASLLAAGPLAAQTYGAAGPRAVALGGATTALPSVAAAQANPASWATLSGVTAGLFVSEAFGLSALRLGDAFASLATPLGTVAGGVRTFGFDAYRESRVLLGYAGGAGFGTHRRLHAGAAVAWRRVSIPTYDPTDALELVLGAMAAVGPGLTLGAVLVNPQAARTTNGTDQDQALALGIGYATDSGLRLVMDVYKDVRYPVSVRGGVEVRPVAILAVRAGATTNPARLTLGIGLHPGRLRIDVAADRHEVLGWSPAVGLGGRW